MRVKQLWKAFGGDRKAIAKALGWALTRVYRLEREGPDALVPILKAFRVTKNHPERFPNPVDWELYEAEQEATYARLKRKRGKRRAKPTAR